MTTDLLDYGPMLADLERRRDEINQAIATIRAVMGLPPGESDGGATSTLTRPLGGGAGLQKHQFFGMKAPEAVKAYLGVVKEARTAAKIAADLMEYGFTTSSANPANTIRTALVRLQEDGEVVQIKKEWGLTGWFPGLRNKRVRKADEEKNGEQDEKTGAAASAKPKSGGWRAYYAERRRAGKTMVEAAAEWRKKKGGGET